MAGSWDCSFMPSYLSPQLLNGLEVMPPVSDLGPLLLQVLPDFKLQFLIVSLQVPHPLQVGGQAVIQGLHGLLFALDAPYARQTPGHPDGWSAEAGGAGHRDPGA